MPPHVFAVLVQLLAVMSAARAYPAFYDSWEDIFGQGADVDYDEGAPQLATAPDCVLNVYNEEPAVLTVGLLMGEDYEEEGAGETAGDVFELGGDEDNFSEVYAKLVAWLLQVDREQAREDAEQLATSFFDDLEA